MSKRISVARGDGIGPEIMDSVLEILKSAGASFDIDYIDIGEKVYLSGNSAGIKEEDWKTLVDNKVLLKAPITTPQGGGYKSLNVTIRKTLGLYSNVRPVKSYAPYVATKHPNMDLMIIRENEEDLYGGIEHRQTEEVFQCLKLITKPGTEKIIRYAFEYAKQAGRKKVTCMTKDNIMKLTDGLFHKTFTEISKEYPEIESEHYIIDIGTARLADTPEIFDVLVLPNLYGDILSDVAAQIAGSVGLAGSANIGENFAMFEAIHGSAPDIAGQNIANPSGLILASVQMLNHLGMSDIAEKVENAWLLTIEEGMHTKDIYNEQSNFQCVSTKEFTAAVIERLGKTPSQLKAVSYEDQRETIRKAYQPKRSNKKLDGVDIFVCEDNRKPDALGERLLELTNGHELSLDMITNRGVKVFPNGNPQTFCTDHWRCRFSADESGNKAVDAKSVSNLIAKLVDEGIEVIKTENLYSFDGERGYSLGQGQ